jgi:hypothetical protein
VPNESGLHRTLPVRAELDRTVPMTTEQRDRAVKAMAALLASTSIEDIEAADELKAA